MTLKEKFTEEIFNSSYQVLYPSKFVKIADDYAIEFADWLNTLEAKYLIEDLILIGELNKNPKTKELLKIFKKEKGL
jgi:hypothetical protein